MQSCQRAAQAGARSSKNRCVFVQRQFACIGARRIIWRRLSRGLLPGSGAIGLAGVLWEESSMGIVEASPTPSYPRKASGR